MSESKFDSYVNSIETLFQAGDSEVDKNLKKPQTFE